ncbi:MAG: hypothetical protein DMG04_14255 [Acidobacteria bacterium]|nr:MAG: hypothetical protein DMG04_14255 [Acidobacteriota bacterium]
MSVHPPAIDGLSAVCARLSTASHAPMSVTRATNIPTDITPRTALMGPSCRQALSASPAIISTAVGDGNEKTVTGMVW